MASDTSKVKRNIARMIDLGATEQEIDLYVASEGASPDQLRTVSMSQDIARSIPAGVARGIAGMAGLPRFGADLVDSGVAWVGDALGMGRGSDAGPSIQIMPSADTVTGAIEGATGKLYQPKTRAGEYARSIGEFLPNAIVPGTWAQRAIAGVLAPAVASEAAGGAFEGSNLETPARIAGALTGGIGGTIGLQAINARRAGVDGFSAGSSRVLEKNIGADAERRLAELGPDAFLYEASPDMFGVAQTIATKPGFGRGQIVDAATSRHMGANQRLATDVDTILGPEPVPSRVEASLKAQRDVVGKDYGGATRGGQRVNVEPIIKALNNEIQIEAGIPKDTLVKIKGYLYGQDKIKNAAGEIEYKPRLKTSPAEILNVRQAVDELIPTLEAGGNAHRQAVAFRSKIDEALGKAAPEVHVVDAKYAELMKQSEALVTGQSVLNTGKTAIRPWELAQDMTAMTAAQKDMLVKGARAEIGRIVGTNANDVTKLRQLIQSEGDWNREKLVRLFGANKADRIISTIEREAKFQTSHQKIVENSQTAQRVAGAKMVDDATGQTPIRDLTLLGLVADAGRQIKDTARGLMSSARRNELASAVTAQGSARDQLVARIRAAQAKRARGGTTVPRELIRLMTGAGAATVPNR